MISYEDAVKQAEKELGLQTISYLDSITPIHNYYAYKNGTCTVFDNIEEANKFSKIVEMFILNRKEIDEFDKNRDEVNTAIYHRAYDIWMDALKKKYSDIPVGVFNICYDNAYDRGHSAGYDEVASYMSDAVYFAKDIIDMIKMQDIMNGSISSIDTI